MLGPGANFAAAFALMHAGGSEWRLWCGGRQRALLLGPSSAGEGKRGAVGAALLGFTGAFTLAVGAFAANL